MSQDQHGPARRESERGEEGGKVVPWEGWTGGGGRERGGGDSGGGQQEHKLAGEESKEESKAIFN